MLALVLTLNPILEKWYWIKDFDKGKSFHVKDYGYTIGGGGINVAKVINGFNEQVMVMGFTGGDSGRHIEIQLANMGIAHKLIPIEEESTYTIRILGEDDIFTEIIEEGPSIAAEEVSKLYDSFNEFVCKWEHICISGDIPKGLPKDILYNLIILAKKYNKKFFLSTGGTYLEAGLKAIPYFLCLTKEELEAYLGCSIKSKLEIIQLGKNLSQDGIEVVIFFLSKEDVFVFKDGYIYMVRIPNIKIVNYAGVKDSMVGGYIASLMRKYDFEFTIKVSIACGLADAMTVEPGRVDMTDMKRIMKELVIIKAQF